MATTNNVATITAPITDGTQNLSGVAGLTNSITIDSQSTSGVLYGSTFRFIENNDGSLTVTFWNYNLNKTQIINLPSLVSPNAITQINRLNSNPPQLSGLYTIEYGGANANYVNSSIQYMYIFGTSNGTNVITAPSAINAVSIINTGSGNDTITGAGGYSTIDGGGGTNTLNGLGGSNYFRMYTTDNGTSTISAQSGSTNLLQIYMPGSTSFPVWDDTKVNIQQIGTDLIGFVKDANGNTSNFTIKNLFSSSSSNTPLLNFGASFVYGGSTNVQNFGLNQLGSTGYEIFAGSTTSQTFDLTAVKGLNKAYVFGNGTNDVVKIATSVPTDVYEPIGSNSKVIFNVANKNYNWTPVFSTANSYKIQIIGPGTTTGSNTTYYVSNASELDFTDGLFKIQNSDSANFTIPDLPPQSKTLPYSTIAIDLTSNAVVTAGAGFSDVFVGSNATINQSNGGSLIAELGSSSSNFKISSVNKGPNGALSGFIAKDNVGTMGAINIGLGVTWLSFNGEGLFLDYTKNSFVPYASTMYYPDLPMLLMDSSSVSVSEGKTVSLSVYGFNVTNNNQPYPNLTMPYTVTGTGNAASVSTSGTLKLDANGNASISVTIPTNKVVGDSGTVLLTLANGQKSSLVAVTDATASTSQIQGKLFLTSNSTFLVQDSLAVNGNGNNDTVRVAGSPNAQLDANINTLVLDSPLSSYKFGISGTTISVVDSSLSPVVTFSGLNQSLKMVFNDGAANLQLTGISKASLGSTTFTSSTPISLTPTLDTTTKPSSFAASTTPSGKLFVSSNASVTVSDSVNVLGSSGYETVILKGAKNVILDANVEQTNLDVSLSSLYFAVVGTTITLSSDAQGLTPVVTYSGLNGPEKLVFGDGSTQTLQLNGLNNAALGTTSFSSTPVKLATGGPVAVSSANAGQTLDSVGGDYTFNVTAGAYAVTIKNFTAGDKIASFKGAMLSILNASGSDGQMVINLADPISSNTTVITLTGLTTQIDGSIFSVPSFNTAFGAGSLL
jgi:hypothetical protein